MRVTLLVTSFNSLSQLLFTYLKDKGVSVDVLFARDDRTIIEELQTFSPDIILAPYLHYFIPKEVYENYATFIFHPGIVGDRGAYSLEKALDYEEWGVSIIKANALYDGGDIYATNSFKVRQTYKASLYRNEVKESYFALLETFFSHIKEDKKIPQILHPLNTREDITIDWEEDTTQIIVQKINKLDSIPGIIDEILGMKVALFGAHAEEKLSGKKVKEILAKRDGAICLATKDGAVWISHLKELHGFKLPATYLLKEKISGIKESRLPLLFDKSYETFYELSVEMKEKVAYLSFDFHNGAMSSQQSIRLKYAIEYLKEECEVLVLCGGKDFFSNGIHLNILEDSKKQGEDGWSNINAMNDVIKSILEAEDIVTVAALSNNAGAGGVFLALACDKVVAKKSVVLNPHYKTLALSGSEYHSYTLPKRVGQAKAEKILDEALPLSASYAQSIGMIDECYTSKEFSKALHEYTLTLYSQEFIWQKQDEIEAQREKIEQCKTQELEKMYPEFWDEKSAFHQYRHEFVYKVCKQKTPEYLRGVNHA